MSGPELYGRWQRCIFFNLGLNATCRSFFLVKAMELRDLDFGPSFGFQGFVMMEFAAWGAKDISRAQWSFAGKVEEQGLGGLRYCFMFSIWFCTAVFGDIFWPLGVYFVRLFLGIERKWWNQVFNTYGVEFFMPVYLVLCTVGWLALCSSWQVGEDRFPSGCVPVLYGINVESLLLFGCDEVAAEMHIS